MIILSSFIEIDLVQPKQFPYQRTVDDTKVPDVHSLQNNLYYFILSTKVHFDCNYYVNVRIQFFNYGPVLQLWPGNWSSRESNPSPLGERRVHNQLCHSNCQHGRLARWIKWRACDVGEAKEGLENELWRRWSNRRVGEWVVAQVKRWKCWRMSRTQFTYVTTHSPTLLSLYLGHSSFSIPYVVSPTSQIILQPFFRFLRHRQSSFSNLCHFTYVKAHSPTLLSLYLHHSSFSNLSVASPTSQLILQPFFRFSYVTGSSPGEPPMVFCVF